MTTENKPDSTPPADRRRRVKWIVMGAAGLLLIYTLIGFLGLPWWIKTSGARRLGDLIQRPVKIAEAAFNPFTFTLRLKGISIQETDGGPLVAVAQIDADLEPSAYLGGTATVRTLQIQQPEVHVTRLADGSVNLAKLAPPPAPATAPEKEKTKPTRFLLGDFSLSDGRVVFRDETVGGFETTVAPLGLKVANLTNRAGEKAAYDLALSTAAGEHLKLEGALDLAGPPAAEGKLSVTAIPLAHYAPYYRNLVGFDKAMGHLDLALAYRYADGQALIEALSVTLADLTLQNPATGETFLTLPRLAVDGGRIDTRTRAVTVTRIGLEGLAVTARRGADGRIDVLDLVAAPGTAVEKPDEVAQPAPATQDPPGWTVNIQTVAVGAGPLRFEDPSAVQPAQVGLENLSLEVADIAIGTAGATVGQAGLVLQNLTVADPTGNTPLIEVPQINVSEGRLDSAQRRASVAKIALTGTRINALRRTDGTVNLAGLFAAASDKPAGPGPAPPAPESAQPAWTFDLGALVLEDQAIEFKDQIPDPDTRILVDQVTLTVENFSTAEAAEPKLDLKCRINQAGTVAVSGSARLKPLTSELALTVKDLPIQPFQPYFSDQVGLIVTDGRVGVKGRLSLALPEGAPARIRYRGGADITRFASVDKRHARDFLRWKSLFVEGADIATEPMRIEVGQVALSDYYARLIVNADGTLNAAEIFGPQGEGDPPAPAPAPKETPAAGKPAPVPVKIDEVTLQGGQVDFSDFLAQPNFETRMVKLGGRISGLSSDAAQRADVLIQGTLENQSPLEISGRINPLAQETYTDLKLTFRNIELSPFSPYSGKYLGYTLAKGKLNLELAYKIAERKLQAQNKIFFDTLTLGNRVESPEATSLPIKLALALLTDRQGRIELDVPVKGDLDDPEFSIFGIVIKALVNLLTKIITSPFDAMASLFGGKVVTHMDFEPGLAALGDSAQEQITALAGALYERPALKLEIEGLADPQSDAPAIRQQRFDELLRAAKLKALVAQGQSGARLEDIQVAPEEVPEIVAQAYAEADFPKPRDEAGKEKILPPEEMEKLLFTQIEVSDNDLRRLANERAGAVRDRLLADERMSADRIFMVEPRVEKAEDPAAGRRVRFSLK